MEMILGNKQEGDQSDEEMKKWDSGQKCQNVAVAWSEICLEQDQANRQERRGKKIGLT